MGYYTTFTLDLYGTQEDKDGFADALITRSNNHDDVKTLFRDGCVDAKLYYLDNWIDEVALKYPALLVVLRGCGEEQDDIWETRWRGEETETHIIAMPPFVNEHLQVPEKTY